ncbi:AhpD family alkylhydroperoxidase [Melghirimyces profundicolus]|uniref:AhpD family alkylhydroperoxidase n=1 Tax=Melghirimyces profundicolus TaxID=1242148 RepID=A0A2T6C0M5_9BACL|nr:carboxymuconolactone decarboxylase family protein [Melghirimyces profundicolus]PTX61861.1 AhpD family alkylhydroperoxidase [Melghirimyces profundicolus]
MGSNLYDKVHIRHLKKLGDLVPDVHKAHQGFAEAVMKDGVLSVKEKELIAVAVAHSTECPFCIDSHTKGAKKAGASLEELAEAVYVTASIEAGGAFAHSANMHNALDEAADDALYRRSSMEHMKKLRQHAPEPFDAMMRFFQTATAEGKLSVKLKELIAVAVAHTTECPYCIDIHSKAARKAGASDAELAEAILVTAYLRSGGAWAHMALMIQAYGEE